MKICITGGIACGKSLFSQFLNELGIETLDADDIVHELIPDPAERRRIAAEVFVDPVKRHALEARIHPLVKARILEFLAPSIPPPPPAPTPLFSTSIRIAIIPLLFEVHWESEFDIICCVVSSRANQIARMVGNRGMSREEAEARIAAQLAAAEKAARSDYVIENDGSPGELREQVVKFVNWLKSQS